MVSRMYLMVFMFHDYPNDNCATSREKMRLGSNLMSLSLESFPAGE